MSQPVSAATVRPRAVFPARMRLVLTVVIIALLLINAFVVLTLPLGRATTAPVDPAREQVFYDQGGHMQITLPSTWVAVQESPNIFMLFATDQNSDGALTLFRESKSDLSDLDPKYQTLDGYAALLTGQLTGALGGTQGQLVPLTIGGLPGRQVEVSGTNQGNSITGLVTFVEAPDAFYQIRLMTVSHRFAADRAMFSKAAQSFRVRGP